MSDFVIIFERYYHETPGQSVNSIVLFQPGCRGGINKKVPEPMILKRLCVPCSKKRLGAFGPLAFLAVPPSYACLNKSNTPLLNMKNSCFINKDIFKKIWALRISLVSASAVREHRQERQGAKSTKTIFKKLTITSSSGRCVRCCCPCRQCCRRRTSL
jgi:hypothetical protein